MPTKNIKICSYGCSTTDSWWNQCITYRKCHGFVSNDDTASTGSACLAVPDSLDNSLYTDGARELFSVTSPSRYQREERCQVHRHDSLLHPALLQLCMVADFFQRSAVYTSIHMADDSMGDDYRDDMEDFESVLESNTDVSPLSTVVHLRSLSKSDDCNIKLM